VRSQARDRRAQPIKANVKSPEANEIDATAKKIEIDGVLAGFT
jgi:hypothetical protein